MIKSNLLPVETSGVSQEGTLVIELFLMTNYRFRRNILNGKVEFAILPDFLANLPEWDGQNHIADVFERLISVMQDSYPTLKNKTGIICILLQVTSSLV